MDVVGRYFPMFFVLGFAIILLIMAVDYVYRKKIRKQNSYVVRNNNIDKFMNNNYKSVSESEIVNTLNHYDINYRGR